MPGNLQASRRSPRLRGSNLEAVLTNIPPANLVYAQAGGAKYGDGYEGPIIVTAVTPTWNEHPEGSAGPHRYRLSEYLKSSAVIVHGTRITRHELIKYVANKLGGAHFDASRRPDKDEDQKFAVLDQNLGTVNLPAADRLGGDGRGVYLELLSIG